MFKRLLVLNLISVSLVASGEFLDPFVDHLKNNLNKEIGPCENFYRHVCPLKMKRNQTTAIQLIPNDVMEEVEKLKETDLEKRLIFLAETTNAPIIDAATGFLIGLRPRDILLKYFRDKVPIMRSDFEEIEAKVRGIISIIHTQKMNSRSNMDHQVQKRFMELTSDSIRRLSLDRWPESFNISAYSALYESLNKVFYGFLSLTSNNHELAMTQLIEHITALYFLAPQDFQSIVLSSAFQSADVRIQNTVKIPEIAAYLDTWFETATFYGTVGSTYATELFRSFDNQFRMIGPKKRECRRKHTKAVCETFGADEWKEKECQNNKTKNPLRTFCPCEEGLEFTAREDLVDIEALDIAYQAYKKDFATKLLEEPYRDLPGITNEKLFFYSYASLWCSEAPEQNYELGSFEAANYVKVNSAVAFSKPFLEAFGCEKESKLYTIHEETEKECKAQPAKPKDLKEILESRLSDSLSTTIPPIKDPNPTMEHI